MEKGVTTYCSFAFFLHTKSAWLNRRARVKPTRKTFRVQHIELLEKHTAAHCQVVLHTLQLPVVVLPMDLARLFAHER